MLHSYNINGKSITVELQSDAEYDFGQNEILSRKFGDLTSNKSWYGQGFCVVPGREFFEIEDLYQATTDVLKKIISEFGGVFDSLDFRLENYHKYVDDELHAKIIERTRRLYPKDLGIDVQKITEKVGDYLGHKLSFHNNVSGKDHWIIVRINKPKSQNYNTAHKDIYEALDNHGRIPKMVNLWIPVCGVAKGNALPVAPGSHLIPENQIRRTKAGSKMNGNQYSVASIAEWRGSSKLISPNITQGDLLVFSSHLIHGLAINNNEDVTRISFELRLHEKMSST